MITQILLALLVAYIASSLATAYYNAYLSPLAKFPGPKLRHAFYFPEFWHILKNSTVQATKELHDRYGDVVRLTPEALSYRIPEAWKDIYGYSSQGKQQIQKDEKRFLAKVDSNIMKSSDADHARMRKLVAHAFSETALREQEPLMDAYFKTYLQQLRKQIDGTEKGVIDFEKWYKLITYDVVADLSIGESFGALEKGEYHPWMQAFLGSFQMLRFAQLGAAYPAFGVFLKIMSKNPKVAKMRDMIFGFTRGKTEKRLDTTTDRKDFMSYVLRYNDDRGMTRSEILPTMAILVNAGGGTTSDVLSAVTYYVLRDPAVHKNLRQEVRARFANETDITLINVNQLPYLNAVIEETLRLHPPAAGIFARRTGPEGATVAGQFVPPNTSLGVHQYAINRCSKYFHNPEAFVPERWLDDAPQAYKDHDVKAAMQPFSYGPRNCIGKNLAYFEMRSILARTFWAFDMQLMQESKDWDKPPRFANGWISPALKVKLSRREE